MIFITGKENSVEERTSTIFLTVFLASPIWRTASCCEKLLGSPPAPFLIAHIPNEVLFRIKKQTVLVVEDRIVLGKQLFSFPL